MADVNLVVVAGRLTRDPELKYTQGNNTPFLNMAIAVNKSVKKQDGSWQKMVNFIDVSVWGRQAETCAQHLSKGSQVLVQGELEQQRWQDQSGQNRSKIKVRAGRVSFIGPKNSGGQQPESEGEMQLEEPGAEAPV